MKISELLDKLEKENILDQNLSGYFVVKDVEINYRVFSADDHEDCTIRLVYYELDDRGERVILS